MDDEDKKFVRSIYVALIAMYLLGVGSGWTIHRDQDLKKERAEVMATLKKIMEGIQEKNPVLETHVK